MTRLTLTARGVQPEHRWRPDRRPTAEWRRDPEVRRRARVQILRDPRCAWCGATTDLQADHVVAIADGGDPLGELQTLCGRCNRAKERDARRRRARGGRDLALPVAPYPDAQRPDWHIESPRMQGHWLSDGSLVTTFTPNPPDGRAVSSTLNPEHAEIFLSALRKMHPRRRRWWHRL